MVNKKVFISYSQETEVHTEWVLKFASTLHQHGIDIILDKLNYDRRDSWSAFMAKSINQSDYCILICTEKYKLKSEALDGQSGVGIESVIMLQHFYQNPEKFIPIAIHSPKQCIPFFLHQYAYYDFSKHSKQEEVFEELIREILSIPNYILEENNKFSPLSSKIIPPFTETKNVSKSKEMKEKAFLLRDEFYLYFEKKQITSSAHKYKYIERHIRQTQDDKEIILSTSSFLNDFLKIDNNLPTLILGEYGAGKTTFSYDILIKISTTYTTHIPILIQCKKFTKNITNIESWLDFLLSSDYGENQPYIFSWDVTVQELVKINKNEPIVLIIDGFDEAVPGQNISTEDLFKKLSNFLFKKKIKSIILTRTNSFPSIQANNIIKYNSPFPMIGEKKLHVSTNKSQVIFLPEFKDTEIIDYFKFSLINKKDSENIIKKIFSEDRLKKIARKPIFSNLLLRIGPSLISKNFTIIDIYRTITDKWIDTGRGIKDDEKDKLRTFLQEISFYMFIRDEREIENTVFEKIISIITEGENEYKDLNRIIENSSLLIRNTYGKFIFSHNTILEYFVSQKLFEELKNYNNTNLYIKLLTDPINQFLFEEINSITTIDNDSHAFCTKNMTIVEEDPVFNQKNNCNISQFYIDIHPVTNEDYQSFISSHKNMLPPTPEGRTLLNDLMNKENLDWSVHDVDGYLKACQRFVWDFINKNPPIGAHDYPVIYVSFFDAWLFAKSRNKQIPSYQQWAKACLWNPRTKSIEPPNINEKNFAARYNLDGINNGPIATSHSTGTKSFYGVQNCFGNVCEWTSSWFDEANCFLSIVGGAWHFPSEKLLSQLKSYSLPNIRRNFVGFRCIAKVKLGQENK